MMYALTCSIFVLSNLFLMILISVLIENVADMIQSHGHVGLYSDNPKSFEYFLYNGYVISSLLGFIVTWIATASILYYYSARIGKIKYWIIMSLPLIYFLNQFNPILLDLLLPLVEQDLFFYLALITIALSIGKAAGGILYGLAFWVMGGRTLGLAKLKLYLVLVAIGFMFLFVAERAITLIALPFPPFGFISVATVGLSSYLILIGLYYAAISISTDVELRKWLRTSTIKELTLIGRIGSAEINKDTEKAVFKILKKNLATEKPYTTFSPAEMKDYMEEIMDEIKKMHPKS